VIAGGLLHLIELFREGLLNLSAVLISPAVTYGYSRYSRKLGTNLINAGALVFQSFRKPLELFKDGIDTGLCEKSNSVFGVLVEVCVKDPLVHEVFVAADVKQNPPKIVQLKRR
jgi:hypothetical protein